MISPIYSQSNADPPTGKQAAHQNATACQIAWHRYGMAVIDPDTVTDEWVRQAIINEANRQYGKRDK